MQAVIGPVVTRKGGYAFDLWTAEAGLSGSFCYRRVEDAHHARRFEIGSRSRDSRGPMLACATLEQFAGALGDHRADAPRACGL